jgi:hypothetical protein
MLNIIRKHAYIVVGYKEPAYKLLTTYCSCYASALIYLVSFVVYYLQIIVYRCFIDYVLQIQTDSRGLIL